MIGNKVKNREKDLKKKGIKYLTDHYGEEFAKKHGESFTAGLIENYNNINEGRPIGNLSQTIAFIDLISEIDKN